VALIGTLGVVLRAKRNGVIASAVTVLRQLREVGLHLGDATIAAALAGATDERWVP
jgi:predicted nucleic acid-binding protein